MCKKNILLALTCIFCSSTATQAMLPYSGEDNLNRSEHSHLNAITKEISVLEFEETKKNGIFQTPCKMPMGGMNPNASEGVIMPGEPISEATTQWPRCAHGAVQVWFKTTPRWGAGTIIGPNLVLTAASNLYDRDSRKTAGNIWFFPTKKGPENPFGPVRVCKGYIPTEYIQDGKEDFALLLLNQDLSLKTGYLGLSIFEPEQLNNLKNKLPFNIGGYSSDKESHEFQVNNYKVNEDYISYEDSIIRTNKLKNGSALYYEVRAHYNKKIQKEYFVVGINTSTTDSTKATFLTKNRLNTIKGWIKNSKPSAQETIDLNNHNTTFIRVQHKNLLPTTSGYFLVKEITNYIFFNLKTIKLRNNAVFSDGLELLSKADLLHLQDLDLAGNWITTNSLGTRDLRGMQSFTRANLPNLIRLNLEGNHLGGSNAQDRVSGNAMTLLARSNLDCLKILMLGDNNFTVEIISLKETRWPLEYLSLVRNNITDYIMDQFNERNNWKASLKRLDLCDNIPLDNWFTTDPTFFRQRGWNSLREVYVGDSYGTLPDESFGGYGSLNYIAECPGLLSGENVINKKRKIENQESNKCENNRLAKKQKPNDQEPNPFLIFKIPDKILEGGVAWSIDISYQAQTPTCCSHSIVNALKYVHGGGTMDPLRLHDKAHTYYHTDRAKGLFIGKVMQYVQECGVEGSTLREETKKYAFRRIYNVYEKEPGNTKVEKIKNALVRLNHPIVISVLSSINGKNIFHPGTAPLPLYSQLTKKNQQILLNENLGRSLQSQAQDTTAHAVIVYGFCNPSNGFLIKNSWGTSIDSKGRSILDFDYLEEHHNGEAYIGWGPRVQD